MNENLILEFDELIRSIEISKNDAFSFLLGAGASIYRVFNLQASVFGNGKEIFI